MYESSWVAEAHGQGGINSSEVRQAAHTDTRTHTHTATSQWTQQRAPNLNDNQTEIPVPLKNNTR